MKTAVINKEKEISRGEFAKNFISSYDEAVKIMQGKLPRPRMNARQHMAELQKWIEENPND